MKNSTFHNNRKEQLKNWIKSLELISKSEKGKLLYDSKQNQFVIENKSTSQICIHLNESSAKKMWDTINK